MTEEATDTSCLLSDGQVILMIGNTISPRARVRALPRTFRRKCPIWILVSSLVLSPKPLKAPEHELLLPIFLFTLDVMRSLHCSREHKWCGPKIWLSSEWSARWQSIFLLTKMEWHAIYEKLTNISSLKTFHYNNLFLFVQMEKYREWFCSYLKFNVLKGEESNNLIRT